MLEKFKFWKHTPEPSMGLEQLPPDLGPMPGAQPDFSRPDPAFQQLSQLTPKANDKDLELINAKLDVIKAQLDAIMQRLDRQEQKRETTRW